MWSTLQQHITDIQLKLNFILKKHLFTLTEEESLIQWILSMNQHNMSSKIVIAWEMASLLVAQHFKSITLSLIDQNWIQKFINCHDTLKSKYNHKYNYQQAKCEDLKLI